MIQFNPNLSQFNPELYPQSRQVNVSPSLMGSSPLDRKIKGTLIADLFHLVGFYPHDPDLAKKMSTEESPFSFSTMARVGGSSWGSECCFLIELTHRFDSSGHGQSGLLEKEESSRKHRLVCLVGGIGTVAFIAHDRR